MPSVIFFRAVNVGGHQSFKPAALAKHLSALDIVNLGAAGTWVVRARIAPASLRAEILRHLPFQPHLIICPAARVLDLIRADPFARVPGAADAGKFVTILDRAPARVPPLPVELPPGGRWVIQLVAVVGQFALTVRRPREPGEFYPNPIVEKLLGRPATTRNWNTFLSLGRILAAT